MDDEVRKGAVLALGGVEGLGWSSAAEILAVAAHWLDAAGCKLCQII